MINIEKTVLRRFSGGRIVFASIMLALAGYMPLQAYVWFGPEHGNPIGLGLLAVATLPIAAVGVAVGLIKVLVERVRRDGR